METPIKFHPKLMKTLALVKAEIPFTDELAFRGYENSVQELAWSQAACLTCGHAGWLLYKSKTKLDKETPFFFSFELGLCAKWSTAVANSRVEPGYSTTQGPGLPSYCNVHSSLDTDDTEGDGGAADTNETRNDTIPEGMRAQEHDKSVALALHSFKEQNPGLYDKNGDYLHRK